MSQPQERDAAVADCLRRHTDVLRPAGPRQWELELCGSTEPLTARMDRHWLRFRVPLMAAVGHPAFGAERLAELLRHNARLRGGAKFSLRSDRPGLQLQAEIPLDEETPLDRWIPEAIDGLREAVARFTGNCDRDPRQPAPPTASGQCGAEPRSASDRRLAEICEETGWPFAERSGGQVAVPLDTGRLFCQAMMDLAEDGRCRARVELDGDQPCSAASAFGVDVLLLSACRVACMARAVAISVDELTRHFWEVILPDMPGVDELKHALSALSVACRITARETQALRDEPTAQKYLAARGWPSLLLNDSPS